MQDFKHNVIIGDEAVAGMMRGIKLAVDLIRPTYGGNGTNVVVEQNKNPGHGIYNDAWSIIQSIKTESPAEKRGLAFAQELCESADKLQGDSRKTTLILLDTILEEGYKSKINKLKLKRELDSLICFIESEIDKQTKQITVDDVYGVARTASESEETGKILQEIYKEIGKNGILTVEGSGTYETSYKLTNGVRFEMTGMLSPEMVHDEEAIKDKQKETKAVYENPWILLTKKKISSDDDINPLLVEIANSDYGNKNLVIFTNDMDSGVASMLVGLHKNKGFTDKYGNFRPLNILIIKAPTLWQNYVFEDFAKCTGATIIEDATGKTFKNMKLEDLGTCGKIEVDNDDTILTGIADITDHLKTLATKGDDDSLLRLSWLATKSAILKLGANSSSDLSYKRLKCNDANRSTYLALQHGVVKGGGLCLSTIPIEQDSDAKTILYKALQAPLKQAMENYGLSFEEYEKLITDDILDSSAVLKKAVRNAVGIASIILTAPALTFIPKLSPEEMAYRVATTQSNPFNQN